ncbi:MAG: DedA family protein [Planctomycetota bacterium]
MLTVLECAADYLGHAVACSADSLHYLTNNISILAAQAAESQAAASQAVSNGAAGSEHLSWVIGVLNDWGYAGIIFILVLCGLGLPVPEEITLIGSGYLAYVAKSNGVDHPNWILASVVCVFGILLGDTVVYGLGRKFGNSLLKLPIIRHELTPSRLEKFDRLFHKYGDRAIFFSRFFMGVRLASYFVAGRQKMSYFKFLFLDLCGALLSGPTSVFFGYYFGKEIDRAFAWAHKSNYVLIGIVVVVIVAFIIFARIKSKRSKAGATTPTH